MANSSEFDANSPHPVIDLMPEQKDIDEKGGTMRLGLYPCKIIKDSSAIEYMKASLYMKGTDTDMSSTMNTGSFDIKGTDSGRFVSK